MKKLFATIGTTAVLALGMASCGNNKEEAAASAALQMERYKDSIRMAADTAGLAEFQQWKSQNELTTEEQAEDLAVAPVARAYAPSRSSSATTRRTTASSSSNSDGGTYSSSSTNAAKAPQKEGMSKAAKGAIIGGAGGAIAGAVINKKNRAAGAVVGGVIGGGGGYIIGRKKDKKDGRY